MNEDERKDFQQFCRQATSAQLWAIILKERTAGREVEAGIAETVADSRGLDVDHA